MTSHNLVILGGLEEFAPLVRLACDRGIRTIVIDGYSKGPAKRLSVERGGAAYDIDIRDVDAIAEVVRLERADAITTAYSDVLLECAVLVADRTGLPCHLTPAQLPYYRDKDVINETLDRAGIPGPKSAVLEEGFDDYDLNGLSFPLVVKPIDLYGCRGLFLTNGIDEIRACFEDARKGSSRSAVLVEEYVGDREFNAQALVRDGVVHVIGIADREKTVHVPGELPPGTRNVYPSRYMEDVYEPALAAMNAYIRETGQTSGPLAMQFYWSPERGLQVGEVAARFLGYEHELVAYACGFSVEELLLAAAYDDGAIEGQLAAGDPFGHCIAAVLYFYARDGVVGDLDEARAVARRSDVKYGQLFYEEGDRIGSPQKMPYVARFYVVDDDRAVVDRVSAEIFDEIRIPDEAGEDLLYRNRVEGSA